MERFVVVDSKYLQEHARGGLFNKSSFFSMDFLLIHRVFLGLQKSLALLFNTRVCPPPPPLVL